MRAEVVRERVRELFGRCEAASDSLPHGRSDLCLGRRLSGLRFGLER